MTSTYWNLNKITSIFISICLNLYVKYLLETRLKVQRTYCRRAKATKTRKGFSLIRAE